MKAYLESEKQISIHVDTWFYGGKTGNFVLYHDSQPHPLHIERIEESEDVFIYHAEIPEALESGHTYEIYEKYGSHCLLLFSGNYIRSEAFDRRYAYPGDDLGPNYTPACTVFKLWAPLARRVFLLDHRDQQTHPMVREERGVWTCRLEKDCDAMPYTYLVDNIERIEETPDPYAISSTANGRHSYVIDKSKLAFSIDKSKLPKLAGLHEAITYELSVRDFTVQQKQATFDALVEHFDYIERLGITNLQLLPVYDFATVNEEDRFSLYNWGYDPFNYNVLDGSFVADPNAPYARLNAFGRLIAHANARGIRVSMDVVYNHLYDTEAAPYNKTVPGYYTRYHEDGTHSNGSFCGNDFRSEGAMVRKFIVDSVVMYARVLGVDGFRFDLMGDIDVRTMNEVRKALGPDVLVYGEGWNMPSALPETERACIENQDQMPGIGHFNDRFRNTFKGTSHDEQGRGLLLGSDEPAEHLAELILGSPHVFSEPSQSVNYVECHDNHTFYDWISTVHKMTNPVEARDICALGLATVLLSFGAPFIHAGQEFMRTKKGVENSYNASDEINQFDWERAAAHEELVEFTRELIRFRKSRPQYKLDAAHLQRQVEVRQPAPNVVEIRSDNLHIFFNFSNQTVAVEGVNDSFASNRLIQPGQLKKHQVCFYAPVLSDKKETYIELLEKNEQYSLLKLTGRLDMRGVNAVQTLFTKLVAEADMPAIIDVSEVTYAASIGIQMLMRNAKTLGRNNKKMVLLNPRETVREVIKMAGLNAVVGLADSVDSARRMLGLG